MAYPSFDTGWPGDTSTSSTSSNYVALFKTAYADTLRLKTQVMDSVLSDTFTPETIMGDPLMFDSYKSVSLLQRGRGSIYGKVVTDSNTDDVDDSTGNVAYKETQNERRQMKPQFWEFAELFDPRDERALMRAIQPDGTYVQNVAAAFNRKKDDVIIQSFHDAAVIDGVAAANTDGSTATLNLTHLHAFRNDVDLAYGGSGNVSTGEGSEVLSSGTPAAGNNIAGTIGALVDADDSGEAGLQQVVAAYAVPLAGGNAKGSFHLQKVLTGLQVLQTNGVPSGSKIYCALSPSSAAQLMQEAQYTSADYNALRPLQSGMPVDFMGVEFRVCAQIPRQTVLTDYENRAFGGTAATDGLLDTDTGHYAYLYTDQAMIFGQGDEMSIRFDEIPERGYSLQAYHDFSLGAIRMDPKQVVIIPSV